MFIMLHGKNCLEKLDFITNILLIDLRHVARVKNPGGGDVLPLPKFPPPPMTQPKSPYMQDCKFKSSKHFFFICVAIFISFSCLATLIFPKSRAQKLGTNCFFKVWHFKFKILACFQKWKVHIKALEIVTV